MGNVTEVFEKETTEQGDTETTEETTAAVENTETATETEEVTETATPAEDMVPKAALLDERRKRQTAEDLNFELQRSQLEVPDPTYDPEAHAAFVRQQEINGRVSGSRETVRTLKDDYDEMEVVFMSMVQDPQGNVINQTLINQMNAAKTPALFAYNKATEYLEAQKYLDPAQRAKHEADLKADWLKELQDQDPEVPNLTRTTASGRNGVERIQGAETISDIFPESDP